MEACGTDARAFEALGLGPRLRGAAGSAGGWSTSGEFFSGGLALALLFLQAEAVLASAVCGSGAAVEVADSDGATGGGAGGVPAAATGCATDAAMGGTEASGASSEAMSAFGLFGRRLCAANASEAAFADCTGSSPCELEGLLNSGAETVPVAACKKCKPKEKTIQWEVRAGIARNQFN